MGNEVGGHVTLMGEKRKVYRVLMGKPGRKRALGRRRHRWEDGIRMGLRVIEWVEWSGFRWLRIGVGGWLL
jgi:hypothetical protein